MHEWIQLAITIIMFISSGLAAVLRVGYLFGQHEKRLDGKISKATLDMREDYRTRIERLGSELEGKRSRVYERFDEYKKFVELTFVRHDMCSIVHTNSAVEISEMKAQINILGGKIDEVKNLLLEHKK